MPPPLLAIAKADRFTVLTWLQVVHDTISELGEMGNMQFKDVSSVAVLS